MPKKATQSEAKEKNRAQTIEPIVDKSNDEYNNDAHYGAN